MPKRGSALWLMSLFITMGAVECGGMNWFSALTGTAAAFLLYIIEGRGGTLPPVLRSLQVIWLAVPLWAAARGAAALFPDASNCYYVPAVVLALSWWLSGKKGAAACCAVAAYFVIAAVGIVAVFALPDLQLKWLRPIWNWREAVLAMALGAGGFFLRQIEGEAPPLGWKIAAYGMPTVLCAIVGGCLSPELSGVQASAFYTLSRSISVFGVAERFEALIAACLCLGFFSSSTMVLCAARSLFPKKAGGVLSALLCLAALSASGTTRGGVFGAAGIIILWVLLPLIKKRKNNKKSVDKIGKR